MKDDKAIEKRLIAGGGAALGSLAGWALAKWREAEEAYPYAVVGGLLGFAATEAAMYIFAPSQRIRESIATMVADEGRRLGKPVERQHVLLALERFDLDRLKLFQRYVKAFIARDMPALNAMLPEWRAKMAPIIKEAPEWTRYEGIIFGG